MQQNYHNQKYVSPELPGDHEIVFVAVQNYWFALKYAAPKLQGDREILLAVVKHDGWSLRYAATELKADQEFFEEVRKYCSPRALSSWGMDANRAAA